MRGIFRKIYNGLTGDLSNLVKCTNRYRGKRGMDKTKEVSQSPPSFRQVRTKLNLKILILLIVRKVYKYSVDINKMTLNKEVR